MPRFTYTCAECGAYDDIVPTAESPSECPKCGAVGHREFSPTSNILIPAWMKAGADESHSRWVNSPEVQQGLKDGTYARYADVHSKPGTTINA